jgi:murein DD-endopeptidase MepM/ murein hydrolase activator NlpD
MVRPLLCCGTLLMALVLPAGAEAHSSTGSGGVAAPDRPEIEKVRCATGAVTSCPRGELLELEGEYLDVANTVTFLGRKGSEDDRRAAAEDASAHSLVVRIPPSAQTGRIRVSSSVPGLQAKGPRVRVARAPVSPEVQLTAPAADGVFPVAGKYDFGTYVNGFGGGRNHRGQDILAGCGQKILAARAGVVSTSTFEGAAGNYVVVEAADGTSQVYMHMRDRALVRKGQEVAAGQQIGFVGTTGRSTACHLHFEMWTAPGWYRGGEAIDPLPLLKEWAAG